MRDTIVASVADLGEFAGMLGLTMWWTLRGGYQPVGLKMEANLVTCLHKADACKSQRGMMVYAAKTVRVVSMVRG